MNMDLMKSAMGMIRAQRLNEATAEIQKQLGVAQPAPSPGVTRPLREVLAMLRLNKTPAPGGDALPHAAELSEPHMPKGAEFLSRSFSCAAGRRDYKLYVPAARGTEKRPLLVMLHGCTQNPDDFARGTRMNVIGEAQGMLVAYPAQSKSANVSACWNWFNPKDQHRGSGEPSIIAGLTHEIIAAYDIDPERVFIAGLSAGGAMAVVMGATYPDLYAAVGVHSGLPYQSARDVMSAFEVMRGQSRRTALATTMRTIIFHGDADKTVHSSNGMDIAGSPHREQAAGKNHGPRATSGGRDYTRTTTLDAAGHPLIDHWLIHGAGHAWSGGSTSGSYTDPSGPDASSEMGKFFLDSRKKSIMQKSRDLD